MAFIASPLALSAPHTLRNSVCVPTPCSSSSVVLTMTLSRRACLRNLALLAAATLSPSISRAAMYSSETTPSYQAVGDPKKLASYMPQIEAGYEALLALRDDWDAKTRDYDGDVVRRILGTVGLKSPLFNIRKSFFKAWQIIAETSTDDALIERLESEWNDVLNGISSIDFQLYSVSFTELTESKESLIKQGRASLNDTIDIYGKTLADFRSAL